ncbi:MAG: flagellar biosynthesis protein FlhF [Deltaproteobacteria bacterium]
MQIKRFEGTSMEEILARARKTLGDDALILSARKRTRGTLGAFSEAIYEVSAAVDPGAHAGPSEPLPPAPAGPRAPAAPPATPPPFEAVLSFEQEIAPLREEIATLKSFLALVRREQENAPGREWQERLDRLAGDIRSLRSLLETVAPAPSPPVVPPPPRPADEAPPPPEPEDADWLLRRLEEQGVEAPLRKRIREQALARVPASGRPGIADLWREAGAVIESSVCTGDLPAPPATGPRILVFVGPSGAGKTVTVSRVAARLAGKGARCAAVSFGKDPSESRLLRSLLHPHGIPTLDASNGAELVAATARCFGAGYLLLDISGRSSGDRDSIRTLTEAFRGRTPVDFCLTLPAAWGGTRADRLVRTFAPTPIRYLNFTKLDETDRYGEILNAAASTGLPILFLTGGRKLPIIPARPSLFSRLLLGKEAPCEERIP